MINSRAFPKIVVRKNQMRKIHFKKLYKILTLRDIGAVVVVLKCIFFQCMINIALV